MKVIPLTFVRGRDAVDLAVISTVVNRSDLDASRKLAALRWLTEAPMPLVERVAVLEVLDPDGLQAWREEHSG